jgi:hypothetical protein
MAQNCVFWTFRDAGTLKNIICRYANFDRKMSKSVRDFDNFSTPAAPQSLDTIFFFSQILFYGSLSTDI